MKIKRNVVAIALLSTASFSVLAAPAYRLTDLGVSHNGDRSVAYSISNTGLVAGSTRSRVPTGLGTDTRGTTNAARFYTETNHVEDLGGLGYAGGHGSAAAKAINDGGLVAGYAPVYDLSGERNYQSFVHHNKTGFMQNIGTLGNGKQSRAYGINNNGKVVGWSNTLADGSDNVAYVYDSATGSMAQLQGSLLGGARSFAFDINDADQIVGTATTSAGGISGFIYENGIATSMGSLDGSGHSEARAVNENGVATGFSLDANNLYTAFIYDDVNGMQSLGGMGGDSKGTDVNIHGDVIGSATDAEGESHVFIYQDGEMFDLLSLLSASDQALLSSFRGAYSINDDGTIVGDANFWTDEANGRSARHAFMLTAVPVPGAIFLMGPALGLLGFMGKRRS